jgi:hypothetical protein
MLPIPSPATRLQHKKSLVGREENGAPGEIRTPDLLLRRQSLYPSELRAHSPQFTWGVSKHQLSGVQSVRYSCSGLEHRETQWRTSKKRSTGQHPTYAICPVERAAVISRGEITTARSRENLYPRPTSESLTNGLVRRRHRHGRHDHHRDLRHGLRGRAHRRQRVRSWDGLRSRSGFVRPPAIRSTR